jgi:hypothetical protein
LELRRTSVEVPPAGFKPPVPVKPKPPTPSPIVPILKAILRKLPFLLPFFLGVPALLKLLRDAKKKAEEAAKKKAEEEAKKPELLDLKFGPKPKGDGDGKSDDSGQDEAGEDEAAEKEKPDLEDLKFGSKGSGAGTGQNNGVSQQDGGQPQVKNLGLQFEV